MTNASKFWMAVVTVGGSVVLSGCVLEKQESADRFREALPKSDQVEVSGPEDAQSTQGAKSAPSADEPWANGPWAKYYGFTRHVRDGVNAITGVILGGVWLAVHTEPTSIDDKQAIWGPWTDSLEPATWRFRVTEVADDKYEYRLEGRPKASSDDGAFRPVLLGFGFAKGHPEHGDGNFTIDLDVLRELDPFHLGADDSGQVIIRHDLPPNITDNLFAFPRTVTAEVRPSATDAWWTATSQANEDGTGSLIVNALDDADDSNATAKEDIEIVSQWDRHGAGRADITLSGGDIPAEPGIVTAVECWDTDFYRVYYDDSIDWSPTEGEPSACVFDQSVSP